MQCTFPRGGNIEHSGKKQQLQPVSKQRLRRSVLLTGRRTTVEDNVPALTPSFRRGDSSQPL